MALSCCAQPAPRRATLASFCSVLAEKLRCPEPAASVAIGKCKLGDWELHRCCPLVCLLCVARIPLVFRSYSACLPLVFHLRLRWPCGVSQGRIKLWIGPRAGTARSAQIHVTVPGKLECPGYVAAAASREGSRSGELDAAVGVSTAPVPGVDSAGLSAIQISPRFPMKPFPSAVRGPRRTLSHRSKFPCVGCGDKA